MSTCMQGREVSTRGLFSASRRRGEHMHARQGGPHARPLLRLHAASMPPQSDAIRRTQPQSDSTFASMPPRPRADFSPKEIEARLLRVTIGRSSGVSPGNGLRAYLMRRAIRCNQGAIKELGRLSRQRFASVPDEARNQMQSRRNQGAWASLAVTAGERTRQPRPRAAAADPPAARARSAPRESRYRGKASAPLGVRSRRSR